MILHERKEKGNENQFKRVPTLATNMAILQTI